MRAKVRSLLSVNVLAFLLGTLLFFLVFGLRSGSFLLPSILSGLLFVFLCLDAIAWHFVGIRRIELRDDGINVWRGWREDFLGLSFWEISGIYEVASGARCFIHILTGGKVKHFSGVHWVSGSRVSIGSDSFDTIEFEVFRALLERMIASWKIPRLVSLLMAGGNPMRLVQDEASREEAGALLTRILLCPYDETRAEEERLLEEYAKSLQGQPPPAVLTIDEVASLAEAGPHEGGQGEGQKVNASKPFWPTALTIDPGRKIRALTVLHRLYPDDPDRIPVALCADEDEGVADLARSYRIPRRRDRANGGE